MQDFLIKVNEFKFKHILAEGYEIHEGIKNVADEKIMADGTRRRNYDNFEDVNIRVTLSDMTEAELQEYMKVLKVPDKTEYKVTYYSIDSKAYKTKIFFIDFPPTVVKTIKGQVRVMPFTLTFEYAREAN